MARAAAAKRAGLKLSAQEIRRRLQCARTYPTEAQIRQALADFRTWEEAPTTPISLRGVFILKAQTPSFWGMYGVNGEATLHCVALAFTPLVGAGQQGRAAWAKRSASLFILRGHELTGQFAVTFGVVAMVGGRVLGVGWVGGETGLYQVMPGREIANGVGDLALGGIRLGALDPVSDLTLRQLQIGLMFEAESESPVPSSRWLPSRGDHDGSEGF